MRRRQAGFDLLFLLIVIALGAWYLMPRAASFDPEGGPLTIDGVALGMTKDQVVEVLGEPDDRDTLGRGRLALATDFYYGPGVRRAARLVPTFEDYDVRVHFDYRGRVGFVWGKRLLQQDRALIQVGENGNRGTSEAWGLPLEIGSPDRTDIRLIPVPLRGEDYAATGEVPQFYGLIVRQGLVEQVGLAYPDNDEAFSFPGLPSETESGFEP